MNDNPSFREKLRGLWHVVLFHPLLSGAILAFSVIAAILEGIGIGFLIPIIEQSQVSGVGESSQVGEIFGDIYGFLGIPFTFTTVVLGICLVMTTRYLSSFLVGWLRAILRISYTKSLREEAFSATLDAQVSYFDKHGSDEILNIIITESNDGARTIIDFVRLVEQTLLVLVYFGVAVYIAPTLTLVAIIFLGLMTLVVRFGIESGYSVGDRVAIANREIQEAVQAGTQGIRDVKLFGLSGELYDDFDSAIEQWTDSRVIISRNREIMDKVYQLVVFLTVISLVYVGFQYTSLSLAGLALFLFAIFRLAPRVSTINNLLYNIEGNLPHLLRAQQFIRALGEQTELTDTNEPVPSEVTVIEFRNVSFSYAGDEKTMENVSFTLRKGEFVGFAGSSGAGKSTIVSLLTRMYEPDAGVITANGQPICSFDIREWRECISVVRQQPFIFNDTLRYNLTVASRDATEEEIIDACEIAKITEFLEELPRGLETEVGDDGVKLSGGQRQRVAIARAILKDADVLILDEATSDLDSGLEKEVHDAIESLDREYAILVIAHRLSTIRNADRIHTMENGRIIESGPHQDLASSDGRYAELHEKQQE